MNNELERICKEAVEAQFKILSWHLPGGTEESHEKPQSGKPISGSTFEPRTSRIRSRSDNHSSRYSVLLHEAQSFLRSEQSLG
jgi:hypothetical protein